MLETLRSQDLPPEFLDDENVTLTLPRRLGLSDVVEAQIRRYRSDARRRRRVPDPEVLDLMHLVIRRPDAEEVFLQVGRGLEEEEGRGWRSMLPGRAALALARARVDRTLRALFGRRLVRAAGRGFVLEATDSFLIESDPGGEACAIVTGLAERVLTRYVEPGGTVVHTSCRGRGDDGCLWEFQRDPADDRP